MSVQELLSEKEQLWGSLRGAWLHNRGSDLLLSLLQSTWCNFWHKEAGITFQAYFGVDALTETSYYTLMKRLQMPLNPPFHVQQ
jgi:hypothetical protein